jgi:hypothetical protein
VSTGHLALTRKIALRLAENNFYFPSATGGQESKGLRAFYERFFSFAGGG